MTRRSIRFALLLGGLLAAPVLLAAPQQDQSMPPAQMKPAGQQDKPMPAMRNRMKSQMMGRHHMPGTVTAVDHATGIVKVDSLGMPLVVHFPPPTIKDLKVGDKISLLLGYRVRMR